MTNIPCILALLATYANLIGAQDPGYCNIESCEDNPHTLCYYAVYPPSDTCGTIQGLGLADDDIQELLDAHNNLRDFIASGEETRGNPGPMPAATNMQTLVWNDELAYIAQTWVDQCIIEHDKCSNTADYQVGQNIAFTQDSRKVPIYSTLTELVTEWYDEIDVFDSSLIDNYVFDESYGHFSQVVWAETREVGCGYLRFKNDDVHYKSYLLCNYGPSGNMRGDSIYETD